MTNNTLKVPNKFWIFLVASLITGIIAFVELKGQVNALDNEVSDKGSALRQEFEADSEILDQVYKSVIRLEANQKLLMGAFNLVPVE